MKKHSRFVIIVAAGLLGAAALACAVGGNAAPEPVVEEPQIALPSPTPPAIPTAVPTVAPTSPPADTGPQLPETTGEQTASILFGSIRDGFAGLYYLAADNAFVSSLVPGDGPQGHLVWPDVSPDGTRLAVVSVQGSPALRPNGIFITDLNGGNATQITFGEGKHPAWSPDGTHIAFTCEDGQDVCLINADGSERVNLTADNTLLDAWPDWTADGRIVFMSSRDTGGPGLAEIYIMNADGSEVTRLTEDGSAYNAHPNVSANGQIVYESDRAVTIGSELYVMDLDGANQRRLTNDEVWNQAPIWSADGTSILYTANDPIGGNIDLFLMPAGGGDAVRLTQNPAEDGGFRLGYAWLPQPMSRPEWKREGEVTFLLTLPPGSAPITNAVLFAANSVNCPECLETGIYAVNFDGANLTKMPLEGLYPAWDPNYERIAYTNNGELWIANTDGSSPTQITHAMWGMSGVRWDSRGLTIVADCVPYEQHDICAIDPATGAIRNVTIERTFDTGIAYPEWFENGFALGSQLLTRDGEPFDSLPAAGPVSPDGLKVVTLLDGEIAVVGFDGGDPTEATDDGSPKSFPRWGADSSLILYTEVGEDGRLTLRMVRSDGSVNYPLAENPIGIGDANTYYGYNWAP